ncbi:MAG: hypothetical protein KAS53_02490 [Candidatus Cloacimonetes bacterium]|nr:hypothetical protein [Candidatus Cloacimonadota bacterium]
MKIDSYYFGNIVIDGKEYNSDVIIFADRVSSSWRRLKGHLLQLADINEILEYNPDTIIIGTGSYGLMKIHTNVTLELKNRNIELIEEKTKKAIEIYNQISSDRNVIAGLHLTC